jgi:D-serine dehydratase
MLETLASACPHLWLNDCQGVALPADAPSVDLIADAAARFARFEGLLATLFPEFADQGGRVRSPLHDARALRDDTWQADARAGRWFIKRDDLLPIAGSIKARGGFHEVLSIAEDLALQAGLIDARAPRTLLATPRCRALFECHALAVGSTGNLGLSIGVIGAALGFRTIVHMSVEAKDWKKARLRARGVDVVEHAGDYEAAVAAGRDQAAVTPNMHFVDDESSERLFFGYSVAARELAVQLEAAGCQVDRDHPLFVYIPCGVGGAPGGITFGLKAIFGEAVHCFFAEPCASPCMLLRLAAPEDANLSVYDIGLSNQTAADGLAVGRASRLVAPLMRCQLAGVFTVDDERLFVELGRAKRQMDIDLEPSAAAALHGPSLLLRSEAGMRYLATRSIDSASVTHVVWATGGSLVPAVEHRRFQRLAELACVAVGLASSQD